MGREGSSRGTTQFGGAFCAAHFAPTDIGLPGNVETTV